MNAVIFHLDMLGDIQYMLLHSILTCPWHHYKSISKMTLPPRAVFNDSVNIFTGIVFKVWHIVILK